MRVIVVTVFHQSFYSFASIQSVLFLLGSQYPLKIGKRIKRGCIAFLIVGRGIALMGL